MMEFAFGLSHNYWCCVYILPGCLKQWCGAGNHSSFCVFAESELNELFSRKAVISSRTPQDSPLPQQAPVSLLSRLVQQYPDGLNNPFLEYAKFDGTVSLAPVVSIRYLKYVS